MPRFYNTLSRSKEEFEPLEPGLVRIYSCGPTVYDYAHIGNFRAFVLADLFKRYLRYRGYEVRHVMNITDVDDKILGRLQQEGVSLEDFTGKYIRAFYEELDLLNVARADVYPRATEHVGEMIELVGALRERGLAYERDGSVYYSVARFPDYGRLARLDLSGMQNGISVDADEYDRDSIRDFVLWKARTAEDGEIYWDSPFGPGRPGWHLECSCMSMKYLGESFDVHTGGVDLVFPHHENEIAQSEGATGKPYVKYWLHNEFLNVDDEKMSKSLGNIHRLRDIAGEPEDFKAYRYMLVVNHYRTTMNFTAEGLAANKRALLRLTRLRRRLAAGAGEEDGPSWADPVARARAQFQQALDDDLNTPRAMAAVFGLVNEVERSLSQEALGGAGAGEVLEFLEEINRVLGIFYALEGEVARPDDLPPELSQLVEEREEARRQKDWGRADELRASLTEAGVEVRDTSAGTEWSWIE